MEPGALFTSLWATHGSYECVFSGTNGRYSSCNTLNAGALRVSLVLNRRASHGCTGSLN
jgi:hypothetical protein